MTANRGKNAAGKPAATRRRGTARDRIMAAALDAFVTGEGDFEIGAVAERAGVSVGLAYHYFGSKAGLLSALITDFYNRHDAVANQRLDRTLPWPRREHTRLKASIDFMYADPAAPIIMGRLSGNVALIAEEAMRREAMVKLAARNVADGQWSGHIDAGIDPAIAGAAIIGGIRQAVAIALASPTPPKPERLLQQLWAFIAGGLSLPPDHE